MEHLFCAFLNDEHFLVNPIQLTCGHSVCKGCVVNKHISSLLCRVCGAFNELSENNVGGSYECRTGCDLNEVFGVLGKRFHKSFQELQEYVQYKERKIETDLGYAKDEVEIRVESLKIELDQLKVELYAQLDGYKNQFTEKLGEIQMQRYDEWLEKLDRNIEVTQDAFRSYTETLSKLEQDLETLKRSFNIGISVKEMSLTSKGIASLYVHDGIEGKIGEHMLKSYHFWAYRNVTDACALSNNTIAVIRSNSNGVKLLDNSWVLIKEVERIDDTPIQRPTAIATDQRDKVYLYYADRILLTDLDFNLLGTYPINCRMKQYEAWIGCMQHYNDHLYVIDEGNSCVLKLTSSLELVNKTALPSCELYRLAIANNHVMIICGDEISFCCLDTFQFKFKYHFKGIHFTSFIVNEFFYAFDDKEWTLYCFDKNGLFIDILSFDLNKNLKETLKDDCTSCKCFYNYNNHTLNFTTGLERMLVYQL